MTRRFFFRLVAGSAAWIATKHVAWAFPTHATGLNLHEVNQVLKDYYENFIIDYLNTPSAIAIMLKNHGIK